MAQPAGAAPEGGAAVHETAARALVGLDPASVYNQVLLAETLNENGDAARARPTRRAICWRPSMAGSAKASTALT